MKKRVKITMEMAADVIYAIAKLKENPMYGLGLLITTLALGISCIGFIIAYITFIVQGGYEIQIDIIRAKDINGAFSDGTIGMLYHGVVGIATPILLLVALIYMLLYFFIKETVIKKVLIIFDIVLSGLIVAFPALIEFSKKVWGDEVVSNFLQESIPIYMDSVYIIVICISIIVIVSFSIIMLKSICCLMFRYIITVAIIIYGIFPIVLYLLENIIAIIISIILLISFIVVLIIFVSSIANSESSDNINSRSNSFSEKQKVDKKEIQPKVMNFNGDVKFYRGKGGHGIMTPTDDCIYYTGNLVEHRFACTVEEFEKGKFVIRLNGKQVTNI